MKVTDDSTDPCNPIMISILRELSSTDVPPLILKTSGVGQSENGESQIGLTVGAAAMQSPSSMAASDLWLSDSVTQMECNLDDITGELLAHVVELLLKSSGVVDAWTTPIVMKKGRPAHTLHCLCLHESEDKVLELLFRHTTTLGIRVHRNLPRAKLHRSIKEAETPYGKVAVKVSTFQTGEIISVKPEFDHCQDISTRTGVPVKLMSEMALSDIRERLR